MDKKTVERYYAAWNSLNTDAPASFYAKEAELVFFDVLPMQYSGWASTRLEFRKSSSIRSPAGNSSRTTIFRLPSAATWPG